MELTAAFDLLHDSVHGSSLDLFNRFVNRRLAQITLVSLLIYSQNSFAQNSTITRAGQCSDRQSTNRTEQDFSRSSIADFDFSISAFAVTPAQHYANKLFVFLTGAPKNRFDPRFINTVKYVEANNYTAAAQLVIADPGFLKIAVRQFSIPFIDPEKQSKDTLTDLQALIIGLTRDQLDARLLLTGDLRYSGYRSLGLPAVSRENNDHYAQFENNAFDLVRDLERVTKQWEDLDEAAGALTTRTWGSAYYKAGTNRLAIKYAFENFLCAPIDTWKMPGLPDSFVRRDVDRQQGGDPAMFQNTCRNCHSAMDAMGGAFAKYDFTKDGISMVKTGVAAKMNNNKHVYDAGFTTVDDSWVNMLASHPTIDFGWRGDLQGNGLQSFAKVLANSGAYSSCLVRKVFKSVCGQSIQSAAPNKLQMMTDNFEQSGYNLKKLFVDVALTSECISHPATGGSIHER